VTNPPEIFRAAVGRLPRLGGVNLVGLGGCAIALSLLLWPAWLHNPDLSHGLFMPVVFVLLLAESRAAGPQRFIPARSRAGGLAAGLAVLAIAVLGLAGVYAAVLDWSHALVEFLLAGSLALLLGAGLIVLADERVRLFPVNWTSVMAILLWPLCAPIPPGTYSRLTSGLQLWVTTAVLHTLHLLGIAAYQTGNILELARATVGVEEACSGVRSLVSCVFAGLFFSASIVTRPWARVAIIAAAGPLALIMNFIRSLALTLMANAGVAIGGFWHDATGYAVLGVTAAILAGLAFWLERDASVRESGTTTPAAGAVRQRGQIALTAALAATAVVALFFFHNTQPSPRRSAADPDLWALLPASPPTWQAAASTNLFQFADILRTKALAQRTYRQAPESGAMEITLYLAYWRPGQAPVSLVASHTPDTCWPGSGWVLQSPPASPASLVVEGRTLAPPEAEFFENAGYPQYVWFWHLYAGRPIPYVNPYSIRRLLSIAWRYGFQHDGEQLFVRVSSNRPWNEVAGEPMVKRFFALIRPYGL
jgi:exosortase